MTAPMSDFGASAGEDEPLYECASCGHKPLQFVAVEGNGDSSYICPDCGDEWFESTLSGRSPE